MGVIDIDWIERSRALSPQVQDFVDGRRQLNRGAHRLDKYSPRDGHKLCEFGDGDAATVDEAVAAARIAFKDGRWSNLPVAQRKDALYQLAGLIERDYEELALLECLDVGKPISDALNFDVPASAANIRFSAEAADKHHGKVYAADESSLSYELRRPMGVVAGIVGWNFPLYLAAQKLGPVLATGNCLVLKPSELTSFSAWRVAELAIEAGIPPGVFNVIHGGRGVGSALARHHDVDLLTFTGSSRTGKELLIAAGQSNMKRLVLECGGKSPNIVFGDCVNLDAAANAILASAFSNQGQVCVASSRVLVQRELKGELVKLLVAKASALSVGDPLLPQTKFGAVVSKDHQGKILRYIARGEQEGAEVVYQSTSPPPFDGGFYAPQVIFDGVVLHHTIAREEIFGPLLSVMAFRNEEEAIKIANETIYGLSAVLWTRDVGRAYRVSHAIDAGWVVVNGTDTPKGGPGEGVLSIGGHKESGIGVEGGLEGLESYTRKSVIQVFV